jgi:hypothetical protein
MTDFDADEPVAPAGKTRRAGFLTSDRFLGWSGALLAVTAAFFPWYVFFNEDKFGLDIATSSNLSRDLPERAGRPIVTVSPSAIGDNDDIAALPKLDGQLITGTVPAGKPVDGLASADGAEQPFPSEAMEFHVLHAAGGRAMIEDKTGVYIVTPGSLLPDLSRVDKVEERDGEWVLVTDKGVVYDTSGKRTQ